MSGIVGIYFPDGRSVENVDLQRMVDHLAHRGPDRFDLWQDGHVGLGHRMLWTTPESLSEQLPRVNSTAGIAITADARLDNRDELASILGIEDKAVTDSDLILRAYQRWGETCPEKLLGDFAFALWDSRRQLLFCARDHMGVKPFYYYHQQGKAFVFASEIKGLLCVPVVARRLNEVRVADYLLAMMDDTTSTFFRDILRLPPASRLAVTPNGIRVEPYWALDPSHEVRLSSDMEYADAFRALFTEAVRCRMRSAFPVGSLLSGGLDSSSITCVARDHLRVNGNKELQTFSAIFDDVPECDERPFMNAVISQGGLRAHFVHGDKVGPLDDLEKVFWHEDEPFFAPNLFLHWSLYDSARRQGVRVLLDGFDGDTTLSHGLVRLTELLMALRWWAMATEISGLAKNFGSTRWKFARAAVSPLVPDAVRQIWRIIRWPYDPWLEDIRIRPDFARHVGLAERFRLNAAKHAIPAKTQREEHFRRLTWGLVSFVLQVADRAAKAFGIDPRYPFFDRRLVEFCLALPGEQKLQGGYTRVIMRRALDKVLPEEVKWRGGKARLGHNFRRGLLVFGKQHLDDILFKNSSRLDDYVEMNSVREAYRRFISGSTNNDDSLAVWRVATLGLWLRWANL